MMPQQAPWMMGQGMPWMMGQPYANQWFPPPAPGIQQLQDQSKVKVESEARATRKATRKDAETNVEEAKNLIH